jgi:hypothetical protein
MGLRLKVVSVESDAHADKVREAVNILLIRNAHPIKIGRAARAVMPTDQERVAIIKIIISPPN